MDSYIIKITWTGSNVWVCGGRKEPVLATLVDFLMHDAEFIQDDLGRMLSNNEDGIVGGNVSSIEKKGDIITVSSDIGRSPDYVTTSDCFRQALIDYFYATKCKPDMLTIKRKKNGVLVFVPSYLGNKRPEPV